MKKILLATALSMGALVGTANADTVLTLIAFGALSVDGKAWLAPTTACRASPQRQIANL
jgi:hypothetical protein